MIIIYKETRIKKGTHQAFKVKDTDKDNINKYKIFFFLIINFNEKSIMNMLKKKEVNLGLVLN